MEGSNPADRAAVAESTRPAAAFVVNLLPPASEPPVKIHLKPIGSAPMLAKNKFKVPAHERFATILSFLRKQLALGEGDALWCFLHSSFAPSPSLIVGDLYRSFASEGELVVHYSLNQAYG